MTLSLAALLQAQDPQDPKKYYSALTPDTQKLGWDIGFDRISVDFSSTSMKNQQAYQNFSNTYFGGNSQLLFEGNLFFHSNYYAPKFVIFNFAFGEYGRNIISPRNSPKIDNTTLDKVFLGSDYTYRAWNFDALGGFDLGPFVQLSYQTQFTRPQTRDRTQILALNAGFKLFDNPYLKTLNLSLFGEENFTYSTPTESMGLSLSLKGEYGFNDFVKIKGFLDFKQYLYNNLPRLYSPSSELEFDLRLDSRIFHTFSIAPFVNFRLLQGRYLSTSATSLILGVSLSYAQIYLKAKKPILEEKQVGAEENQESAQ